MIRNFLRLIGLIAVVLLLIFVLAIASNVASNVQIRYFQREGDFIWEQAAFSAMNGLFALLLLIGLKSLARKAREPGRDARLARWGWLLAAAVMATPILMAIAFAPSLALEWPDGVDAGRLILVSLFLMVVMPFKEEVIFRVATFSLGGMLKLHPVMLLVVQAVIFWVLHGWAGRVSFSAVAWFLSFGILAGVIYYFSGVIAATLTHSVVNFWIAQLSGNERWLLQPMLSGGGLHWKYPTLNVFVPLSIVALIWMVWITRAKTKSVDSVNLCSAQAGSTEIRV